MVMIGASDSDGAPMADFRCMHLHVTPTTGTVSGRTAHLSHVNLMILIGIFQLTRIFIFIHHKVEENIRMSLVHSNTACWHAAYPHFRSAQNAVKRSRQSIFGPERRVPKNHSSCCCCSSCCY